MTEQLHFHFSLSYIGEGNGNPLQCSCLENPRDGGAWWAAVHGVAQSQTRLKRLSSSSYTLPALDSLCKWNHTPFCISTSFSWHVFKVQSCFTVYQHFIPLYGWTMFHCLDPPHFVTHSSTFAHLVDFLFLPIMNNEWCPEHLCTISYVDVCFHFFWR